jgi:phenylacetate-coenzyme A ligase PaaK-like adenylate-forming protein
MPDGSERAHRLGELVLWARENSSFYAERFASVSDSGVEEDLLYQLPILERHQVQPLSRRVESPLACVEPAEFVRFHHTSGSTGDGSLWVFDTASDWEEIVDCWSVALRSFGVEPGDRAMVCAGYGRFIGFWGLHDAFLARGTLTVSGADADSKARATLIERLGITVVAATPTYALRLGDEMKNLNVESQVKLVITSGEPRPLETRERIERLWGCRSLDTAGMTEMGTISMLECPHRPGDMHVLEDRFLEEVLDPVTREPIADGEMGVRVVTPLGRRGMPFIRYWTNDLVVRESAACACSLGAHVYRGGIKGRLDQMVKVDGIWFLPSMLEGVIRGFEEIDEYRAILVRGENGRNIIELELEAFPEAVTEDFPEVFADECKRAIGFRPAVRLVTDLPRFEAKAKRFHDQRLSPVA